MRPLVEPFWHQELGAGAGRPALAFDLDLDAHESLRRRVDDDRAEPERPGESAPAVRKRRCLVRPNDTASSQLSVQRALGEEMLADPLHQFGEGGIGHRVQRARARQRHVVDRRDRAGPLGHDQHAVGEEHGLRNRMRDQQHRLAGLALDPHQLDIHLLARHGVERAERLVHQHDLGIVHQRAADRGALLHAAGELPGQLLLEPFEPDQLQQRLRPRQIFFARQPLHVDRQHHVGQDVAPWQQQRVLEHDADIAVRLRHLLALDQDLAGRRREQPGDHLQQRGLAAAGRADHDEELALVDVEIQRPQRRHVAVARAIGFRDAGQRDARRSAAGAIRHQAQMRAWLIGLGWFGRRVHSAKSISHSPSSLRTQGPIRRALSFGHGGRDLLQQPRPVAMGPCVRRDDDRSSQVRSRTALRQIVVGVKRLRIVLGLGIQPAIFDHQVDRVRHVLVGDLERPLVLGFRRAVERDRQLKALRQRFDLAALRVGVEDRLRGALGILLGGFDRLRRRRHEALDEIGIGLDELGVGDDAGADHVDAVVGELDRVDVLAGGVLDLHRLVHDVAEQQISLAVDDGVQLGLAVARHRLEVAFLQAGLLQEQRPDLRHRIGRRDRHRLALDVLGLLDVLLDKAHRRHRAGLQQHAGGDDRRALDGRAHHGGHVDIAEIGGLGRNRLRGRRRTAAFLDLEVDALGGIDALGLAVIERRVLAIDVPVQHQHDLVGGGCRKH